MQNKLISTDQLLALSYVEAASTGDEEVKSFIISEVGEKAIIDSLTDLSLILAASLAPCHTDNDLGTPDDMADGIAAVLATVRESFIEHS